MESRSKTNSFNSEGRILQIEYAIKNVSNGGTMVGICCTDGVLLFGMKSKSEKIYKLDKNMYMITCGLFSDALQLVTYARVKIQEYLETYEQDITCGALCKKIGKLKQGFTQLNSRPFGVSILYAGYDDGYVLYSTDPSGTVSKWKAKTYGQNQDKINTSLKNELSECSLREASFLLFEVLKKNVEVNPDDVDKYEMLWFIKDKSRFLTKDEIQSYIKA